ncbi:hypothetical protein K8I31_09425, partial [bacterium]|nr:hypothetical protein [bacterium]
MRCAKQISRLAVCLIVYSVFSVMQISAQPIDRFALVNRHNPSLQEANAMSPFSVGNGDFAFTADVTGLQSFPDFYEQGVPLGTLSEWGWHTAPPKNNYALEDTFEYFDVDGREVPYASQTRSDAAKWLRANPHRLHLGQVGFTLKNNEGEPLSLAEIKDVNQSLNLWQGELYSSFKINNTPVEVNT